MTNLNLEIISPTSVIFEGQCHLVVVPSIAGDIGVMRGHEAFISVLREGQVLVYDEQEKLVENFDIKGGFAEVDDGSKLIVLID